MNWITFALLGMVFTGLGNFLFKLSTSAGLPALSASLILFFTEFLLGLVLLFTQRPNLTASGTGLAWAIGGGVSLAAGVFCMITAFSKPGSHTGITTALVNTNFALVIVLSLLVFREGLSLKQIFGLAAIFSGIFLLI